MAEHFHVEDSEKYKILTRANLRQSIADEENRKKYPATFAMMDELGLSNEEVDKAGLPSIHEHLNRSKHKPQTPPSLASDFDAHARAAETENVGLREDVNLWRNTSYALMLLLTLAGVVLWAVAFGGK